MGFLSQLQHVTHLDFSSLVKLFWLIVLPLADEDIAIILGGYIVVNKIMPVALVVVTIYAGMVASDAAFYGIGAAARRLPWLGRFAVDDRVANFADTLQRNLFEMVALCRVVPGLDLIAFIACGWTRVSFGRFMLASLVVSALYLPLMLYLVVIFGDALNDHAGLWTWPCLLAAVTLAGFVRNRIFTLRKTGDDRVDPQPRARNHGLSPIRYRRAPVWRLRTDRVARLRLP